MQTALLGAAIAIILALVTALVGPLFVDWGRFRDAFEAKAQHLTGLEVKIAGPIEVHHSPDADGEAAGDRGAARQGRSSGRGRCKSSSPSTR